MKATMKQQKPIAKKNIIIALLLIELVSSLLFFITLFFNQRVALLFAALTIMSLLGERVLRPWASRPYKHRRYVISVDAEDSGFPREMKAFTSKQITPDYVYSLITAPEVQNPDDPEEVYTEDTIYDENSEEHSDEI